MMQIANNAGVNNAAPKALDQPAALGKAMRNRPQQASQGASRSPVDAPVEPVQSKSGEVLQNLNKGLSLDMKV